MVEFKGYGGGRVGGGEVKGIGCGWGQGGSGGQGVG